MLLEMDMHGIMPGNLTQSTVLDIRELKEKVGDRMAIFDNLNPNGPLLIGTPEEVEKDTLEHLEKAPRDERISVFQRRARRLLTPPEPISRQ